MSLAHDRDGFLIGTPMEIDTRAMERMLDVLRGVKADTQAMVRALRRIDPAGAGAARRLEDRGVALQPVVRAAEKVSRPPRVPAVRVESVRATPARDEKGRFVRAAAAVADPRSGRRTDRTAEVASTRGVNGVAAGEREVQKLAGAVGEAVSTNVSAALNVDQAVRVSSADAAKRKVEAAPSPVNSSGRGLLALWNSWRERKDRHRDAAEPHTRAVRAHSSREPDRDSDSGERREGRLGTTVSAMGTGIKEGAVQAAQGTSQVDPTLGAIKESLELVSPVTNGVKAMGGGLVGMWRDRREARKAQKDAKATAKATVKEQAPWFRRILKALGGLSADGGGLGSLLSGLLPGAGGIGGLLGKGGLIAGGLAGLRGVGVRGVARVAGKSLLPLGALTSAMDSLGTSTADYAKRYGMTEGQSVAKDTAIRFMGVFQDLGNAVTFGLADRLGNWMSGAGFRRSGYVAEPKSGANAEPQSAGNPDAGSSTSTGAVDPAGTPVPTSTKTMSQYTPAERQVLLDSMQRHEGWKPGSRAYRNQNPGNIEYGDFARSMGATGSDGRFAVFPSYAAGRAAQEKLLFESKGYRDLTLDKAVARWAPGHENNVPAYVAAMRRGLPATAATATVPAPVTTARPGAAATPSVTGLPQSRSVVAPSPKQAQLPPPPDIPQQVGSNARGREPVEVIIPERVGQNLADRGIAQLATGGMGGGMIGRTV